MAATAIERIVYATEAPGIVSFSDVLGDPAVQQLATDTPGIAYLRLLRIFAAGTWADYTVAAPELPPLNAAQAAKLRMLTVVSLAQQSDCLSYELLWDALEIRSEGGETGGGDAPAPSPARVLEDILIDALYQDLITGRIDAVRSCLRVYTTTPRDVLSAASIPALAGGAFPTQLRSSVTTLSALRAALDAWGQQTQGVLHALDDEIAAAQNSHLQATTPAARHNALVRALGDARAAALGRPAGQAAAPDSTVADAEEPAAEAESR
ncbi:hypothetical protein MSPP1_003603 [Malassezia sp. CBS 17886]|nr:hypothetical protein MSPP1_003603 [Malassezia sp. CBS 17886]